MEGNLTLPPPRFALALFALCLFAGPATALDPVLAKICREKAIEAYPTKPAGSPTGHAQAQRDFYNKCIANGGKMDSEPQPDAAAKDGNAADPSPPAP
jgi:hypothetical protein